MDFKFLTTFPIHSNQLVQDKILQTVEQDNKALKVIWSNMSVQF